MSQGFGPMFEVARIQSEINRLFESLLDLESRPGEAGAWMPIVDVIESEETLLVKVELPGVAAEHVKVSASSGNVVVEGDKPRLASEGPARHHVAERSYGRFRRVVPLGVPVNTHRAEASLADGLLRVRFPKVPNRRGEAVTIEVKAS